MNSIAQTPNLPSAAFLAYCEAIAPSPEVRAYKAGYARGEVLSETGSGLNYTMSEEVETIYLNQHDGEGFHFDLIRMGEIEQAWIDGIVAGYSGTDPLTDSQIDIYYD